MQKGADSPAGFTGYMWTEAVSGKKKLRIQKYPDTCGGGLMDIEDKFLWNIIKLKRFFRLESNVHSLRHE